MLQSSSYRFILLGLLMIITAWIMVFAMIINLIQETFFLSFISYGLGLGGFFIGLLGVFTTWSQEKEQQEIEELRRAAKQNQDKYQPYFLNFDAEDEDFQEFLEKEEERENEG